MDRFLTYSHYPLLLVILLLGGIFIKMFAYFEPYLFPLHMKQGKQNVISENVIIGPYPKKESLESLKYGRKITTVISLLDGERV